MNSARFRLKDEEILFLVDHMVIKGYDFVYERVATFVNKEINSTEDNTDILLMNMYEELLDKARKIAEFDEKENEKVLVTRNEKSRPLSEIYYDLAGIMRIQAHRARIANSRRPGVKIALDKRFLRLIIRDS